MTSEVAKFSLTGRDFCAVGGVAGTVKDHKFPAGKAVINRPNSSLNSGEKNRLRFSSVPDTEVHEPSIVVPLQPLDNMGSSEGTSFRLLSEE